MFGLLGLSLVKLGQTVWEAQKGFKGGPAKLAIVPLKLLSPTAQGFYYTMGFAIP